MINQPQPLLRHSLNPNDADDSDSSTSTTTTESSCCNTSTPLRRPRRSATVSPSSRHSSGRQKSFRRKSDANLHFFDERERQRERRRSMVRASREKSESRRANIRKTNSEPNVDMPVSIDFETLQKVLLTLPKLAAVASKTKIIADSDSGGEDVMSTEIEELKDAAKSIQSLQRVLALPQQHSSDRGVFSDADDRSLTAESSDTRRSISSRVGHPPRGVMQFIPSMRSDSRRSSIASRKVSAPEYRASTDLDDCPSEAMSKRNRRRGVVDEMFSSASSLLTDRPSSDALAGVNRFSKLLDSFRDRPQSPDQHPTITWSPFVYTSPTQDVGMEDSLHEADVLLWNKRSRASLRRHHSVRNLAAKELYDTEKSFVEGLEFLVTKYMRPLRQPLECTLIEANLVDKIFYRVPEILAHHQVLLAALSQKIEKWHKESVIGDVLLAHFSKQSMIETYIAFVDNFKFAKTAIAQARQKHAFEKYYNRCCRDHQNKLDLDSLLISPIQRVPRYELIVKQMLKHTPVDHEDRERLQKAQRHIRCLANAINEHKECGEQMEQRLREIEAIVDGLDDLVATGRTFIRYDIVNIRESHKQRCIFMLSDLLLLTSVKTKQKTSISKISSQMDFLENNRFKLLVKISLDDIIIAKDTFSQLEEAERNLENAKEDDRVVKKMIQLSNLLKCDKKDLYQLLEEIESKNGLLMRSLHEQMSSNPDLTTVYLHIASQNAIETMGFEFANAEKRSVFEAAFKESFGQLQKLQMSPPMCQIKSIIAHQTRPGLQLCAAAVVPGKRSDSCPFVWICAADKFSGQVAVISLETGDNSIESCSAIGNAAVTAMCTVPPPAKRKRKSRMDKSIDLSAKTERIADLNSSGSDSDSSSDEATSSSSTQTSIWIGNDDGEVFVVNSTERVRTRARERLARLRNSVTAICASNGLVFVATKSSPTDVQLLQFHPNPDRTWDLENPLSIRHEFRSPISSIISIGKRLILASGNALYAYLLDGSGWQKPSEILPSTDTIGVISSSGSLIFVAARRSTIIHVVDVFTLRLLNNFNVAQVVRSQLAGREDILREHKMGSLRVTCFTIVRSHLFIGTSSGFVLNTSVSSAKNQPSPDLKVCEMGHSGPCRVLLPVSLGTSKVQKKTSLSSTFHQSSQLLLLSCGEGLDDQSAKQDPSTDAINHLIFWKLT